MAYWQDQITKEREMTYAILEYNLRSRYNESIRPSIFLSFSFITTSTNVYTSTILHNPFHNTMHQMPSHDEVQLWKKEDHI